MFHLDAEALEMYDGLKFDNDADKTKLEAVHQKFETFCIGETNETYERYKFRHMYDLRLDLFVCHFAFLCLQCSACLLQSFHALSLAY
jgi:hypothetical protein